MRMHHLLVLLAPVLLAEDGIMIKSEASTEWKPRKRVRAKRAVFTDVSDDEYLENSLTEIKPEIKEELDWPAPPLAVSPPPLKRRRGPHLKPSIDEIKDEIKEISVSEITAPPDWQFYVQKVEEMRAQRIAPVDTMGCYDPPPAHADLKVVRFQHLIALMLSSQTKDEVTSSAMSRLRATLKPELCAESILDTPAEDLEPLLVPVGFYRRKAVYIRQTAAILLEKYGGDIPRTIPEMIALPGVGPKMAHLLLQIAWDETEGIGVDVHVHRLAHMWHWVPSTAHPTPEKTRMALEKWLPRELWKEINPLLVGFGQTWCPPRKSVTKCNECLLRQHCPGSAATDFF